jgi:hypothetical protein
MNDIKIRKATSLYDLHAVYRLTHDTYCTSGISSPSPDGLMIHHPGQDVVPQTIIFIAEKFGKTVGTLSFSLDNQFGLMVDEGFKAAIDYHRHIHNNIASVWRFAIHPEHNKDIRIVKKLIGVMALCFKWFNVEICFITLSPQHATIYERLMCLNEVMRGLDSNKLIKPEHSEIVLMKLYPEKLPKYWHATSEREVFV